MSEISSHQNMKNLLWKTSVKEFTGFSNELNLAGWKFWANFRNKNGNIEA